MKIETINIKGYDVEISLDDWQESPREWVSSTLVTAHKNYTFGGIRLTRDAWSIMDAFKRHLNDVDLSEKDIIFVEVFMYEHSGIALSTTPFNCRFDSGQLGYLYEKRSEIRTEFGVKRISPKLERYILSRMVSELQSLEHWANGEVYRFSVVGEEDSCGGFYGCDHNESGLIETAADAIDTIHRHKLHKHTAKLKRLIKAGVGLQYRPALNLQGACYDRTLC